MSNLHESIDSSEAANRDLLCTWLNLPKAPWPPNYDLLLGLAWGQGSTEEIEHRVLERMEKLRQHQLMRPDAVTRGMNLLAQAMNCLTNPITRLEYDRTPGAQPGPSIAHPVMDSRKKISEPPAHKPRQRKPAEKPATTPAPMPLPVARFHDIPYAHPAPTVASDKGSNIVDTPCRPGMWKLPLLAGGIVGLLAFALVGYVLGLYGGDSRSGSGETQGPLPGEERVFDVGRGVKMTFCWIPPANGKVTLGLSKNERDFVTKTFYKGEFPAWLNREHEHEIEVLDGFWMAKTEMTQGQYMCR